MNKGETTTIQGVEGDFCPACGEVVMDMAAGIRHSAAMLAFNKEVNAAIVDPAFIVNVRKKNWRWTRARPLRFSAAASTHSRVTRTARPSRRWRW